MTSSVRKDPAVPPDAHRTGPRPERLTDDEARRHLDHARASRLAQLRALAAAGRPRTGREAAIERDLARIDEAAARLDEGTYGTCLTCARPVPAERLEILPYARTCVACLRRTA
ncbi:TraR/DksA C4-type zinc finger protein [Streptomyces sp. CRN 30]|uniref:TraR/DksA C4-type zinc finger protein n=1 Tax=Streptomyces sp. CRN 30 TaxID=3075613 RepID=UPI0039C2E3AA